MKLDAAPCLWRLPVLGGELTTPRTLSLLLRDAKLCILASLFFFPLVLLCSVRDGHCNPTRALQRGSRENKGV